MRLTKPRRELARKQYGSAEDRRRDEAVNASEELFSQRYDDSPWTPHVAESVQVLVLGHFADEFGAEVGAHAITLLRPSVFGGAIAGSISTSFGLRNFVSSSRPCPSGVRIITMSTWTLSSPLTRSTHSPSTAASPSSSKPSSEKKAIAAARSTTTTLTWSSLLIVMSPVDRTGRARRSRSTVLAARV